jgi:hypothetical protein
MATEDDWTEPEDDHFEIAKRKLTELVRAHQLNEAVAMFRMRDRLRFSVRRIRQLYFTLQNDVVAEFGSPLAESLFPAEIVRDSLSAESSQHPSFRF